MAVSGKLQCMHENVTQSASKWCTDCKESLCDDCCRRHNAHKMLQKHHVIPLEEHEKSEDLNVIFDCPDHRKQFDFYCPTHDATVCVECVQLTHVRCNDLRPLVEAAKGAQTSTALTDLEQTIDELLENIEKGVQHLQEINTSLKEQEDVIKISIATKRAEMNKQLDCLEEKILLNLQSKSEKARNEISLMTTKLETQRKTISDLKDTAQHMKTNSSNLQMFVGIRSILKTVVNEINETKLLVNSTPQLSIAVQFNPKLDTFNDTFDSLGEIQVTAKETVIPYVERRLIQAQFQRPTEPPVHKLDNLQLKLRTNIKMGKRNSRITSCLILPNKSIIVASWSKPSLTILKEDGSHDRDIHVPYDPYGVTIIDDQRVAVSYGWNKTCITCITLVNINIQRTNQTLENLCKQRNWGVSYNDGKLYALSDGEAIKVIDLDGNIIKTIRTEARNAFKVTTQKDKVYYSVDNGSVHCVDLEGTEIWMCQDDRLKSSYLSPAIAVDNYGISFAAGYDNNLLLAISSDGNQQKVLLTGSDGLHKPNALFYDKESKRLLICNSVKGHAALYDVIY